MTDSSCKFLSFSVDLKMFDVILPEDLLLMAEILHQLRLVVYPIICNAFNIPGGCLGFLPSTVPRCMSLSNTPRRLL